MKPQIYAWGPRIDAHNYENAHVLAEQLKLLSHQSGEETLISGRIEYLCANPE
ncbi:MAG TPA: hypothetical protein VKR32_04860 [Puia sp.]|nr:hypothetical protein [Puia sp.]